MVLTPNASFKSRFLYKHVVRNPRVHRAVLAAGEMISKFNRSWLPGLSCAKAVLQLSSDPMEIKQEVKRLAFFVPEGENVLIENPGKLAGSPEAILRLPRFESLLRYFADLEVKKPEEMISALLARGESVDDCIKALEGILDNYGDRRSLLDILPLMIKAGLNTRKIDLLFGRIGGFNEEKAKDISGTMLRSEEFGWLPPENLFRLIIDTINTCGGATPEALKAGDHLLGMEISDRSIRSFFKMLASETTLNKGQKNEDRRPFGKALLAVPGAFKVAEFVLLHDSDTLAELEKYAKTFKNNTWVAYSLLPYFAPKVPLVKSLTLPTDITSAKILMLKIEMLFSMVESDCGKGAPAVIELLPDTFSAMRDVPLGRKIEFIDLLMKKYREGSADALKGDIAALQKYETQTAKLVYLENRVSWLRRNSPFQG